MRGRRELSTRAQPSQRVTPSVRGGDRSAIPPRVSATIPRRSDLAQIGAGAQRDGGPGIEVIQIEGELGCRVGGIERGGGGAGGDGECCQRRQWSVGKDDGHPISRSDPEAGELTGEPLDDSEHIVVAAGRHRRRRRSPAPVDRQARRRSRRTAPTCSGTGFGCCSTMAINVPQEPTGHDRAIEQGPHRKARTLVRSTGRYPDRCEPSTSVTSVTVPTISSVGA